MKAQHQMLDLVFEWTQVGGHDSRTAEDIFETDSDYWIDTDKVS